MDLSNRENDIERKEERRLESNSDGRDGTWISLTTALEEEEIWIATLIVHDHTQPQSHPEQWNEREGEMVVGGIERWCVVLYSHWFMSCCILGVCDSYYVVVVFCYIKWVRWLFIGIVWDLVVVQSVFSFCSWICCDGGFDVPKSGDLLFFYWAGVAFGYLCHLWCAENEDYILKSFILTLSVIWVVIQWRTSRNT